MSNYKMYLKALSKFQKQVISDKVLLGRGVRKCEFVSDDYSDMASVYLTDAFGHLVVGIPSEYLMLSEDVISSPDTAITIRIPEENACDRLVMTNKLRELSNCIAREFEAEDMSKTTLVDKKYLSYFPSATDFYQGRSETAPVLVYCQNHLLGAILPLRHKSL